MSACHKDLEACSFQRTTACPMMDQNPSPPAITALTALILVFFITVPTILRLIQGLRSSLKKDGYENVHEFYEDEDGTATAETQKEYSAAIPKYLSLSSSILGLLASLTAAVITTVVPKTIIYLNHWFLFGSWVRE